MSASILLTAFEPYDDWEENASWLALVELTAHLPDDVQIATRKYPVDFNQIRALINNDLDHNYDLAIHIGQAPGSSRIALEAVALNVRGHVFDGRDPSAENPATRPIIQPDGAGTLAPDGPSAYRTQLPLRQWAEQLNAAGLPSKVSYHAGTYLCNASYYWSQHLARQRQLATQSLFLHIPLAPQQVARRNCDLPSMTSAAIAAALLLIAANATTATPSQTTA